MEVGRASFLGDTLPTYMVDTCILVAKLRATRDSLKGHDDYEIRFRETVVELLAKVMANIPNKTERDYSRERFWEVVESNGFFNFTRKDKVREDLSPDDPRGWNAAKRQHAKRLAKKAAQAASSAQ